MLFQVIWHREHLKIILRELKTLLYTFNNPIFLIIMQEIINGSL